MSDITDNILGEIGGDLDPFKKILSKIPGFNGYIERQSRRDSDKVLREMIASRFEDMWKRVSSLQREFISHGEIKYVDDLESAAIKMRTFADRVRRASRGYSGLFDATKINEEELAKLYQYDAAMLEMVDEINRAIDNIEVSVGTDGLPAAIRNLVNKSGESIDIFEKRDEIVFAPPESA